MQDITQEIERLFKGKNRALVTELIAIVNGLKAWWPLTVRQVFYQAVTKGLIENHINRYKRISENLTTLRREDIIPWRAIEDRTRRTTDRKGLPEVEQYIISDVNLLWRPEYYHRCRVSTQPVYVEILTEKDALSAIFEDAARPFCTRVNIIRGQASATMVNDIATRLHEAQNKYGKRPILIHFGDLDPSGVAIPKSIKNNLLEHHGLDVELIRAALNPNQVIEYQLPEGVDAAKQTDKNYGAWLAEYGKHQKPVELDALHPRLLTDLINDSLLRVYDPELLDAEARREVDDRERLKKMRTDFLLWAENQFPELSDYIADFA